MIHKMVLTFTVCISVALSPVIALATSLEEATYTAIENSPTIKQAIAKFRESTEDVEIARRSGYYPSIDLAAGLGRETTYADESSQDDISLTRRELTLSLNQPIFNGFANRYEVERLQSEAEADRWSALISVENTALEVAQVYANILRYRELVGLAELNLETHERIYGQIKVKSDSGIGRQSDLSQITARLAKANANYYSAVNNLLNAESNYNNIVGEMPSSDLIYPVPDRDLIPTNLEAAISESLNKNPAIEGAYWDIAATQSVEKITDSGKYPTINFSLERTWNNNIDGVQGSNEDLLAIVRLNYNIYSGGTQKRKQEMAVQQSTQAMEIRRKTIRDTELTARLSWAAYEATNKQKAHLRRYVIATKDSKVAYEKQFRLGRRTLLDLLDSENELFQARQDYINADYDELFSEFRLFNAKGELMRAFRIYRPKVLGFNDTFERKQATPDTNLVAIDRLNIAEDTLVDDELPLEIQPLVKRPQPLEESELFLDSSENNHSW